MSQQSVITDADAETARDPPEDERGCEILPTECKQRSYSEDVKKCDRDPAWSS
jgi:hypothetical protein